MKITVLSLIITVIIFGNLIITKAQCSDAGVCSVGHLMEDNSNHILNVTASYKFGSSGKEDDVKYHSFNLGAVYNIFEKTSLQLSVPYNIQSGPLGDANGIGDMLMIVTQNVFANETSSLQASIGAKLAIGDDNKSALPMAYQSGLGTNDFIFAVNYSYEKFGLGVGYQLAGGRNSNIIKLKRGDDLLLRASYNFLLDKFTIMPQLLFIKRLSKSNKYIPEAMAPMDVYVDVPNSDQTQVNLLTSFQYQISKNYSLIADFAIPFIKRDVNVDGLTRSFSASIGIAFTLY